MSASCSRPGCQRSLGATLLYDYRNRIATITPLQPAHPMHYDLCEPHADRITVPQGWTLVDERVAAPVVGLHRATESRRAS